MNLKRTIDDRYEWELENLLNLNSTFAEILATSFPYEIRKMFKEQKKLRRDGHPLLIGKSLSENWINILEGDAMQFLSKRGKEFEYIGIRNIDEFMAVDEEHEGPIIASAQDVILQSHDLREQIKDENIDLAILAAIQLTASAIRFETLSYVHGYFRRSKGRKKITSNAGGKSSRRRFAIEETVKEILIEKGIESSAMFVWNTLSKRYTSANPLSVDLDYEAYIVFVDGDKIFQKNKDGTKLQHLTKKTFIGKIVKRVKKSFNKISP